MGQPLSTPSQLRESALRTLQIEQAAFGGLQAKLDDRSDYLSLKHYLGIRTNHENI